MSESEECSKAFSECDTGCEICQPWVVLMQLSCSETFLMKMARVVKLMYFHDWARQSQWFKGQHLTLSIMRLTTAN